MPAAAATASRGARPGGAGGRSARRLHHARRRDALRGATEHGERTSASASMSAAPSPTSCCMIRSGDMVHTGKLLTTPDDPSVAIVDGHPAHPARGRAAAGRRAQHRARHHAGDQHRHRAHRRQGRADHHGGLPRRRSRSAARSATTSTTSSSKRRRPWCRAICGAKSPSGMDAEGQVLLPLDEIAVAPESDAIWSKASGVEAIAISLPARLPRSRARAARRPRSSAPLYPELPLTLSSEVAPGDPRIRAHQHRLRQCLCAAAACAATSTGWKPSSPRIGFAGRLYVMLSGGGIAAVQEAKEFPIRMIEIRSGGRRHGGRASSARLAGLDRVVSFDMGGTTAKMCLVEDGAPGPQVRFRGRPRPPLRQGLAACR